MRATKLSGSVTLIADPKDMILITISVSSCLSYLRVTLYLRSSSLLVSFSRCEK